MTKHSQTHVDNVYVCFLPFQYNQWVDTDDERVNQHVAEFYHNKQQELDTVDNGLRIMGIALGNPKRYSMEQILTLHETAAAVLESVDDVKVTVDFTVLVKYFDGSTLDALAWTIEAEAPHSIVGYDAQISDVFYRIRAMKEPSNQSAHIRLRALLDELDGTVTDFSRHELDQLVPAYPAEDLSAIEWRTGEAVKQVLLIPLHNDVVVSLLMPLLIAIHETADVSVLFVLYDPQAGPINRIGRAGISVAANDRTQPVLFDMLHYGFQYRVDPIILLIRDSQEQRISTYGKPLQLHQQASRIHVQTPEFELFPSERIHSKLISAQLVQLNAGQYESFADYYSKPFSIVEVQASRPLYYMAALYKFLVQKG